MKQDKEIFKRDTDSFDEQAYYFALNMALCHTVVIDKNGEYNSASPDELALLLAAKQMGFVFEGKNPENIVTIYDENNDKRLKFELLNVCEFSSDRKRMSCIYQEKG